MGMITKMRFFWAALIVLLVIFSVAMIRNNQENYNADIKTGENIQEEIPALTEEANTDNEANIQEEEETNIEITTEEPTGISIQELAQHKNEESCWIVYENKVYDIASYLPRHPGGEKKILDTCGDATSFEEEFERKHGTSKVSLLLKVGVLIGDFDVMGNLEG